MMNGNGMMMVKWMRMRRMKGRQYCNGSDVASKYITLEGIDA